MLAGAKTPAASAVALMGCRDYEADVMSRRIVVSEIVQQDGIDEVPGPFHGMERRYR
jgi:hypothetical protein